MFTPPPHSETELMHNATNIAGKTLQKIAIQNRVAIPSTLNNNKGWVGQLLEHSLGATAGSLPEPDFQYIGVELKTLPLNHNGKPQESTYVCSINLAKLEANWENSVVKNKLARVLWVPIEADPNIPLPARRVGSAILWSPTDQQLAILHRDWEELIEMLAVGQLEQITAYHGEYLQIRPKAANAKSLCHGINYAGEKIHTLPRGFYLRVKLTSQILQNDNVR